MVIQGDRTITIMCQRQTRHFLSTIKSSDISEHPNPATADRGPPLQSHLITAWSQTRNINSIPAWWDSFTSQWGCGQSVTWYAQLQRQCLWFCTLRYINHILHSGSSPKKKEKKTVRNVINSVIRSILGKPLKWNIFWALQGGVCTIVQSFLGLQFTGSVALVMRDTGIVSNLWIDKHT